MRTALQRLRSRMRAEAAATRALDGGPTTEQDRARILAHRMPVSFCIRCGAEIPTPISLASSALCVRCQLLW